MHPLISFLIKNHNKVIKIYKTLENNMDTNNSFQQKWISEMGGQLNEEEWKQVCTEIHKTTNSKYWREFALK